MSVEFMTNPLADEDKRKMAGIMKSVSQARQPDKWEKNAVFLRKFVLALMGQYYKGSHNPLVEKEIEKLNQSFIKQQKPFPRQNRFLPPPLPLRVVNLPAIPSPYSYVRPLQKQAVHEDILPPPLPPEEMSSKHEEQEIKFTKGVYEKTLSTALTPTNQLAATDVLPEHILDIPRPD